MPITWYCQHQKLDCNQHRSDDWDSLGGLLSYWVYDGDSAQEPARDRLELAREKCAKIAASQLQTSHEFLIVSVLSRRKLEIRVEGNWRAKSIDWTNAFRPVPIYFRSVGRQPMRVSLVPLKCECIWPDRGSRQTAGRGISWFVWASRHAAGKKKERLFNQPIKSLLPLLLCPNGRFNGRCLLLGAPVPTSTETSFISNATKTITSCQLTVISLDCLSLIMEKIS